MILSVLGVFAAVWFGVGLAAGVLAHREGNRIGYFTKMARLNGVSRPRFLVTFYLTALAYGPLSLLG